MNKPGLPVPTDFPNLLREVKARIQDAQARAVLSVNAELVRLYWDIGDMIDARQQQKDGVPPSFHNSLTNFATSCRRRRDSRSVTSSGCWRSTALIPTPA